MKRLLLALLLLGCCTAAPAQILPGILAAPASGPASYKSLSVFSLNSSNANNNARFNVAGGDAYNTSSEAAAQFAAHADLKFSNLRGYVSTNAGSTTWTFRESGADSAITATKAGTGSISDTANTVTVESANLYNLVSTITVSATRVEWASMNVEPSAGGFVLQVLGMSNFLATAVADLQANGRWPLAGGQPGDGESAANRARTQWKNREWTSIVGLGGRTGATNARTTASVVQFEVNGSVPAGGLSYSIPSLEVSTNYTATGNEIALVDGDLINLYLALGDAGVEDLTLGSTYATFKSTSNKSALLFASGFGLNRAASATEHFFPPGGRVTTQFAASSPVTDVTWVEIPLGFAASANYFRAQVITNTYTGTATLAMYVNGASVATISIGAGVTGLVGDVDSAITIAATDTVAFSIVGGTSGNLAIGMGGVTLTNQ